MTVAALVPLLVEDKFGARRPPFGQKFFLCELPVMAARWLFGAQSRELDTIHEPLLRSASCCGGAACGAPSALRRAYTAPESCAQRVSRREFGSCETYAVTRRDGYRREAPHRIRNPDALSSESSVVVFSVAQTPRANSYHLSQRLHQLPVPQFPGDPAVLHHRLAP